MPTYRKIDENTIRNIVKKNGKTSTAVRVPMLWIGKEVEVKLVEKQKIYDIK